MVLDFGICISAIPISTVSQVFWYLYLIATSHKFNLPQPHFAHLQSQDIALCPCPIVGLFKVGHYWLLKFLLIGYLLAFYCQIGNK